MTLKRGTLIGNLETTEIAETTEPQFLKGKACEAGFAAFALRRHYCALLRLVRIAPRVLALNPHSFNIKCGENCTRFCYWRMHQHGARAPAP
jgi:hypothetical protein